MNINFKRKKIINSLEFKIQEAIDSECEKQNYTIDYVIIDSALINVLRQNNQDQLKEL